MMCNIHNYLESIKAYIPSKHHTFICYCNIESSGIIMDKDELITKAGNKVIIKNGVVISIKTRIYNLYIFLLNPSTAKLFNLNIHPLEVVSR